MLHAHARILTHTHTHFLAHADTHTDKETHTHIHPPTHTLTHTHTHPHTHTHSDTQTPHNITARPHLQVRIEHCSVGGVGLRKEPEGEEEGEGGERAVADQHLVAVTEGSGSGEFEPPPTFLTSAEQQKQEDQANEQVEKQGVVGGGEEGGAEENQQRIVKVEGLGCITGQAAMTGVMHMQRANYAAPVMVT